MFNIDWSEIHTRKGFSAATPPLAFFSFLYRLGLGLRSKGYRRIERKSLPGFVVSVGNLTAGGTGKTPAVRMLAGWALEEGFRVAVLSRGYGGRSREKVLEVSDSRGITATPVVAGDEPYLLARNLQGVPVIVSKTRYLAGVRAHEKYGSNFYILDDGFQHRSLDRDLDLVLLDKARPLGNGHLLPWGPLREPLGHLERADVLVLTRSGQAPSGDAAEKLKKRFMNKPFFLSDHVPKRVVFPNRNKEYGAETLENKRVVAFAGIARPKVFRETLVGLGARPILFKGFGDHFTYSRDDIDQLIMVKKRLEADYLITTEKDWIRIENFGIEEPDISYLTVTFTIMPDGDGFFRMIREKVEEKAERGMPSG